MKDDDLHLSDQQLLMELEGELSASDQKSAVAHRNACWKCRARRMELETSITDFIRLRQREFDGNLPPIEGPRALLKARLTQLSQHEPARFADWLFLRHRFAWAAATVALVAMGLFFASSMIQGRQARHEPAVIVSVPDATLTPGVALLVSRRALCAQTSTNNKAVPASLQRKVFEEYGIAGADPRAYEVDYLVTPALGGADDIHNLWPHSYSATVWNARVKDALEDRLHEMVCDGSLDLTEAQREIAANWIIAYKKYFHTDEPLSIPREQIAH